MLIADCMVDSRIVCKLLSEHRGTINYTVSVNGQVLTLTPPRQLRKTEKGGRHICNACLWYQSFRRKGKMMMKAFVAVLILATIVCVSGKLILYIISVVASAKQQQA